MTATRRTQRLLGGLATVVAASTLSLTGAPVAHAAAGPSTTLSVSTTAPIAGETVTVRANLPGSFARPLQLQAKLGGRWKTVSRKTSDRAVRARFTYRVPSRASIPLRVVAPTMKRRGTKVSLRRSRVVTVRPRTQSVRFAVTATVVTQTPVRATVTATPARAGRTVRLQHWTGGAWVTVASARQSSSGVARFTVRPSASTSYRALVLARAGAAAVASPRATATVLPGGTGDLGTCDLPVGGTVPWGRGAGATPEPGVGIVTIVTSDRRAVTSGTDYARATLSITEPGGTTQRLSARLKVRGNSTSWARVKLPYKVKLDTKTSTLSMPPSKDWVLLANFYDRSMLRNDVALEAARRLGMPWVPRLRPVEVWMNGTYAGLYQWGEGVEIASSRVDLEEGAALLEADSYEDTDPVFTTRQGLQVFAKKFDDPHDPLIGTAATHMRRAEDVLYSPDFADPERGYRSCLDVASFVDAYLLSELTKNFDSSFHNSVWMVAGKDGRIAMGPPWDFDLGMGNRRDCDIDNPKGWFTARNWFATAPLAENCWWTQLRGPQGTWYHRLLTDPAFAAQVRQRWAQVRDSLATLPEHVSRSAKDVTKAAARNYAPRSSGGAGLPIGPTVLEPANSTVFHGSWQAEASALSTWLRQRIAWLDTQYR